MTEVKLCKYRKRRKSRKYDIFDIFDLLLIVSEEVRRRVTREVEVMVRLDHPNIVRYYDSWFDQQPPDFFQDDANYCAVGRSVDSSIDCPGTSSSSSASASVSSASSSSSSSRSNPPECVTYLHIRMELCRTGTLADWLDRHRERRPAVETCVEILQSVVKAVDYLHDNNFMHRDIKVISLRLISLIFFLSVDLRVLANTAH